MKYFLIAIFAVSLCGCTMVSNNRVFPKLTWYWSKEAKQQRAERELYKQEFPKSTNQLNRTKS